MPNTSVIDALTRHQIFLQRYAGRNVQAILPMLRRIANEIAAKLRTVELTETQASRINIVLREIEDMIAGSVDQVRDTLYPELMKLAEYEAQFVQKVFDGAATVQFAGVSGDSLAAMVTAKPMKLVQGKEIVMTTMNDAYRTFAAGVARDVRQTVQAGIVEGRTTQQIARDVHQMASTRSRRQAEALVRTVTNHVGNTARQSFFETNADLLQGERYVATLDDRTTITCAANDGKIFDVGDGPIPPLHYNCRSVRVPIVKDQFRIPRKQERASIDGPVSAKTTYQSWLEKQPDNFQNEVLGPERAALFRDGDVTLDKFVDNRGVVYTLDQLKAREGLALA